jgi:hypothetical protein
MNTDTTSTPISKPAPSLRRLLVPISLVVWSCAWIVLLNYMRAGRPGNPSPLLEYLVNTQLVSLVAFLAFFLYRAGQHFIALLKK